MHAIALQILLICWLVSGISWLLGSVSVALLVFAIRGVIGISVFFFMIRVGGVAAIKGGVD